MKDKEINGTIVRTSTIPEELGRIEYLLTDKTGTLTRNEMELKRLHMGTLSYSSDTMDEIAQVLKTVLDPKVSEDLSRGYKRSRDISSRIRDIMVALAVCHNVRVSRPFLTPTLNLKHSPIYKVTPVVDTDGSLTYQASSPDEVAIVKFCESMGLSLIYRDISLMRLRSSSGIILEFEVLQMFPFTSESKRMGIIVRDKTTREIWFFQKGADAVMTKIVMFNDWLDEECGNMAREGLRTLVVARRKLSEEFYAEFEQRYTQARVSVIDRGTATANVVRVTLEKDLELLGLTGVEDKLQEDVKSTLESLRNAGLKIWMLTGDKIETATCIAVSSKLVARNQQIHSISRSTHRLSFRILLLLKARVLELTQLRSQRPRQSTRRARHTPVEDESCFNH